MMLWQSSLMSSGNTEPNWWVNVCMGAVVASRSALSIMVKMRTGWRTINLTTVCPKMNSLAFTWILIPDMSMRRPAENRVPPEG